MLWELGGEKASQVYSSWDVAVKLTWGCPRGTKTFLLQQVLSCGMTSAHTDILGRYGNFFRGLRSSVSHEVRVLSNLVTRDLQSTTGKNIMTLMSSSGGDPWIVSPQKLKEGSFQEWAGGNCSSRQVDVWVLEITAQAAPRCQVLDVGRQDGWDPRSSLAV